MLFFTALAFLGISQIERGGLWRVFVSLKAESMKEEVTKLGSYSIP